MNREIYRVSLTGTAAALREAGQLWRFLRRPGWRVPGERTRHSGPATIKLVNLHPPALAA